MNSMLNELRMKQIAISVVILAISFSLVTTTFIISIPKPDQNLKTVPIYSVSIEEPLIKGEKTTIILNGWLPNSCWDYPKEHIVDIYTHTKVIMIYLWAPNHGGGCLEIVRESHYGIALIFPSSGRWSLHVNGLTIEVTIYN